MPCPEMSEWIRIRIKDFYKDAVGETEYTYVSHEVYEALTDLFRREEHAEEMRDLRHLTAGGYIEGETEEQMAGETKSLEDMIIHQMDLETLQKAVQSLTQVQKERLHLYFFEGMTFRQIAEKTGISDMSVRESVEASLKKIKKFPAVRQMRTGIPQGDMGKKREKEDCVEMLEPPDKRGRTMQRFRNPRRKCTK